MKKILGFIPVFLTIILFVALIVIGIINYKTMNVTYGGQAVIDVDIEEIIDNEWVDYSCFWSSGKNKDGKVSTMVTIYWSKENESGVITYITDGKTWEELK